MILKPGQEDKRYTWGEFEIVTTVLPYSKKSRYNTRINALHLAKVALKLIDEYDIRILYGHNPLLCSLATLRVIRSRKHLHLVYEPHNLLYSHFLVRVKQHSYRLLRPLLALYHNNLLRVERELFERAEVIVSQTRSLANCIQEYYSVRPEKIVVAYNGIPKLKGSSHADLSKLGLPIGKKFVIYGGDLSKNNGLHIILQLICNYPEIFFVIAGTGAYFEDLKRLSSTHDNLYFLGKLSKEQYLNVLNRSEALLILRESNITNDNYLPLKLLDAIALRKKVITTNIQIMSEMRQVYDGIYFTQLEIESVAKSIKRCLEARRDEALLLRKDAQMRLSWSYSQSQIEKSLNNIC